MIRKRKGQAIFGGTMAVGLVVILAGAAFACTKFYGKMTVSGNGTGNVATTVNGNPNGNGLTTFFQWCEDPPVFSGTSTATREAFWKTKVDASPASDAELTISVEPATTCLLNGTGHNYLPNSNLYKVGISESYWDETNDGFATGEEDNCHTLETSSGTGYGTVINASNRFVVENQVGTSNPGYGYAQMFHSDNSDIENAGVLESVGGGIGSAGWNTVCLYWPQGASLEEGETNPFFNPANAANFRSV